MATGAWRSSASPRVRRCLLAATLPLLCSLAPLLLACCRRRAAAAVDAPPALPSRTAVGKSTLLTELTGTASEAAGYEFTTLTCIPGVRAEQRRAAPAPHGCRRRACVAGAPAAWIVLLHGVSFLTPQVIHYNDAKIQLLDLPGIIEGAAEGKACACGQRVAWRRWRAVAA